MEGAPLLLQAHIGPMRRGGPVPAKHMPGYSDPAFEQFHGITERQV